MKQDTRSGAHRVPQPILMLRETRFMSREEVMRELRRQSGATQGTASTGGRVPQRTGAGG